MKTILVTGGAGFIGTNLCKKLLDLGHNVIAVDNFITSSGDNTKELKSSPNYTFIKHDITKPFPKNVIARSKMTKPMPAGMQESSPGSKPSSGLPRSARNDGISEIFHLACPTGVPNVTTLGEEMLLTCSIGTRNVLELAKEHKAKFLLTSSSEVYGNPEVFPQKETYTGNVDQIGIRSTYEEGKRFSESLVALYVRKYKLDAKIVRIFNTYGPHMTMTDTRVIPNFIYQIKKNKPLTVQGKGTQRRTFCYVTDLVDGLLTVIEKGKPGDAYNLGGDEEYTIKELAETIIKINGNPKIKISYIPRPGHDHQARRPDLQKVKKLGWKQKIHLEEGLTKTLEWYGL